MQDSKGEKSTHDIRRGGSSPEEAQSQRQLVVLVKVRKIQYDLATCKLSNDPIRFETAYLRDEATLQHP